MIMNWIHSIEQYVYKCFIVHVVARKKILFQLKVDYTQLSLNQDVRNPLSVYIFLKKQFMYHARKENMLNHKKNNYVNVS